MSKYFRIRDNEEHVIGTKFCGECDEDDYPAPCECGGLIHSEFDMDHYSDDTGLIYAYSCDKCGCDYEEV